MSGFTDEVDGEPRCLQCGVHQDEHPDTYTFHTIGGQAVMKSSCEPNEEWQKQWSEKLGVV